MGEFFGSLYCIFEDFFGLELANYLWGVSSPLSETNSFIGVGLTMLAISFVVAVIFYYVLNHPRLNNWWGWLIFLGINAVINFFVGWQWVLRDLYEDKMVTIDPVTMVEVPLNIGNSEILCFGVTNMFLSIFAFIIFSFILKWKSTNCSGAPI